MGRILIFSAPSGSGKSTIIQHLLGHFGRLEFSISATSRLPRGQERDGVDYYFLSPADFEDRVQAGQFIEWEEVYAGTCYGTLRAEIDRIWSKDHVAVFDVDVVGGVNLKRLFGVEALSIFIQPPSIDALRERLIHRATDSVEAIEKRVDKASEELEYAPKFDVRIINDDLVSALTEAEDVVRDFIQ